MSTNDLWLVFVTSLFITLLSGPLLIPVFKRLKFGQTIRSDGPRAHLSKAGTPTMGGAMFLLGIVISLLIFVPANAEIITLLIVTLGHGLIGFADDFIKIVKKRSLGLRARDKITAQILLSLFLGFMTTQYLGQDTSINLPLTKASIHLGIAYYIFIIVVVTGTTNAVNLTDGLDGLAAGSMVFAGLAYFIISLMMENLYLAAVALAVVGSCSSFLFYNRHPAKIFMGDTGSLALGAVLASFAVLTGTELLLPIIGGLFVIETLSVIIQVICFRLTGKRIFRMSPLHHHFELKGWSEVKVVGSFWLVAFVSALLGVVLMYNFA